MPRSLFLAVFLFLVICRPATAADEPVVFQSGSDQAVLIELFTSEGCSSCPPADDWIGGLAHSPYLWNKFVPVAFHVDYWNHLGWTDRLSRPEYSDRERAYAARWRSSSVYTPMIVTGGEESRDWYKSPSLEIRGRKDAGILKIEKTGELSFEITFSPHNNAFMRHAVMHAAYLGSEILTKVEAGENRGKTLQHDFAVLAFQEKSLIYEEGLLKAEVLFDRESFVPAPHHAIAVWVTGPSSAEPLQAAGGILD